MKKVFSGMLLMFLLTLLIFVSSIQPAKAIAAIYISADGSVDPATAPIQHVGDVYTLTDNISILTDADGIVIERDNMILDGAGYTVQGNGAYDRSIDQKAHTSRVCGGVKSYSFLLILHCMK